MSDTKKLHDEHKDLPMDVLKDLQQASWKARLDDPNANLLYCVVTSIIANRSKK